MRLSILGSLLAAFALASPAFAEKVPAAGDKKDAAHAAPAKPTFFVKVGDTYREASPEEVKAAGAVVGGGHDSHGEKKGGLDFTGWKRYDLGIYTIIVFILLLFILGKYAWPNITAGLKKREAAILGARDEANKAKVDAEEVRAKLQKDYADAQDKIRAMLDEARRDSEALRITEREAGTKDAQAERDRARREIQTEKDAVLQEIYQQAVQLASLMSSKTIRRQLSAEDHRKLLEESLAEIKTKM